MLTPEDPDKTTNLTDEHTHTMFLSVPVCGVWHIDVSGWELQDLPGRTYPAVWVRFNLMKVWGQAIVGVLWGRRNVQLQLGCGDVHRHRNGNNGVRMGIMSGKRRLNILRSDLILQFSTDSRDS